MTDLIEVNFTHIKDILSQHKEEVIQAITVEKNKEIMELKSDIRAKEVYINELKEKVGELKGKDEVISGLNK
jgi:hypothetical protein